MTHTTTAAPTAAPPDHGERAIERAAPTADGYTAVPADRALAPVAPAADHSTWEWDDTADAGARAPDYVLYEPGPPEREPQVFSEREVAQAVATAFRIGMQHRVSHVERTEFAGRLIVREPQYFPWWTIGVALAGLAALFREFDLALVLLVLTLLYIVVGPEDLDGRPR